MYEGVDVVESSAVKLQMVGSGSPAGWWCINDTMLPPPPHQLPPSTLFAPSWNHTQAQLPDSWTQLLLGGLAGEDDKHSLMSCMHPKYLHNWDQKSLHFSPQSNHSHQAPLSDQCNSTVTTNGAAPKKAKIQPSSVKSTLKVRKEKVGDRITALHQLVSPFGKTDTASVLLEAIGYIKFLQNQIEALSLPYLDSGSDIMRQQHPLNGKCIKRKGMSDDNLECDEKPKKDLKSRGLCLVPISCTLDVGNDNGTDYWAPAFGANFR